MAPHEEPNARRAATKQTALNSGTCSQPRSETGEVRRTILLTNTHVLPMDAPRVIDNQAVLIRDGRIAAIGSIDVITPPPDALVVDAEGGYLMPGLSDMHAHLPGYSDGGESTNAAQLVANQLLLYLATGVTLLRDMSGSPAHFDYRQRTGSGDLAGPELFFTSPIIEGEDAVWPFSVKLVDPKGADNLVATFAEQGYWGLKVYHTLSSETFDALCIAAKRHGLRVAGHVPFSVGIQRALAQQMCSIEHLRGYDFDGLTAEELAQDGGRSAKRFRALAAMSEDRMVDLVRLTVQARTWNVPTLAINRFLYDRDARAAVANHPRLALVPPALQECVRNPEQLDALFTTDAKEALRGILPRQQELVRRLHQGGAGILVGTDSDIPAYVPGFTPIDEMKLIAKGGVPIFEVLQAGTLDAAVFLGIEDDRGTVSVGKSASLILLKKNPLEDLDHLWDLVGVVHQGRWLSFSNLERELTRLAEQCPAHEG